MEKKNILIKILYIIFSFYFISACSSDNDTALNTTETANLAIETQQDTIGTQVAGSGFSFTLEFNAAVSTDTFTNTDVVLSGITGIENSTISVGNFTVNDTQVEISITLPTNIGGGTFSITVGTDWEDTNGNTPSAENVLYESIVLEGLTVETQQETIAAQNAGSEFSFTLEFNATVSTDTFTEADISLSGIEGIEDSTVSVGNFAVNDTQVEVSITLPDDIDGGTFSITTGTNWEDTNGNTPSSEIVLYDNISLISLTLGSPSHTGISQLLEAVFEYETVSINTFNIAAPDYFLLDTNDTTAYSYASTVNTPVNTYNSEVSIEGDESFDAIDNAYLHFLRAEPSNDIFSNVPTADILPHAFIDTATDKIITEGWTGKGSSIALWDAPSHGSIVQQVMRYVAPEATIDFYYVAQEILYPTGVTEKEITNPADVDYSFVTLPDGITPENVEPSHLNDILKNTSIGNLQSAGLVDINEALFPMGRWNEILQSANAISTIEDVVDGQHLSVNFSIGADKFNVENEGGNWNTTKNDLPCRG